MNARTLLVPPGFDSAANPRVASFAAQLQDQLVRLKRDVEGLEVRQLEWQPQPGVNTIGMLLAHLAVVDLWWLHIAPRETPEPEAESIFLRVIGMNMDDDGLPLPPDGRHPASLAGKTFAEYWDLIERARAAAFDDLSRWKDSELHGTFARGEKQVSREWTAYHVLEHFAGHYGQILLLKHLMRDAGGLPRGD